jgi:hypothetical protein
MASLMHGIIEYGLKSNPSPPLNARRIVMSPIAGGTNRDQHGFYVPTMHEITLGGLYLLGSMSYPEQVEAGRCYEGIKLRMITTS